MDDANWLLPPRRLLPTPDIGHSTWGKRSDTASRVDNRGMFTIDPRYPPLWRDETTLQFGIDAQATLRCDAPWQLRVVEALLRGSEVSDLIAIGRYCDASEAEVTTFIEQLSPVLRASRPRARAYVDVPETCGDALAFAVLEHLRPEVDLVHDDRDDATVVLVGTYLVHPGRAAALVRDGIPHLPVVFTGDSVTIGPLVTREPGPCIACEHEHRRSTDASWPALALQALMRQSPLPPTPLFAAAMSATVDVLSDRIEGRVRDRMLMISGPTLRRQWVSRSAHPECACQFPAQSANALASIAPSSAPTTVTAFARLA